MRGAFKAALRKYLPYYFKEFVFFPALAGPFFWKVMLGNWLSELMRDLYSAATIYCGHVGEDTKSYPAGKKAQSRGEWYAMQIEASNNFEVSRPLSILCGGLDHQIVYGETSNIRLFGTAWIGYTEVRMFEFDYFFAGAFSYYERGTGRLYLEAVRTLLVPGWIRWRTD